MMSFYLKGGHCISFLYGVTRGIGHIIHILGGKFTRNKKRQPIEQRHTLQSQAFSRSRLYLRCIGGSGFGVGVEGERSCMANRRCNTGLVC